MGSGEHALGFLHTNNFGRRWQPASPDFGTFRTIGHAMQWSFAGPSSGWLLNHTGTRAGTRLYYTADQGHRWVQIQIQIHPVQFILCDADIRKGKYL